MRRAGFPTGITPRLDNRGGLYKFYSDVIAEAKTKDIVFDRFHLSEIVYGNLIRGKSRITPAQAARLTERILSSGGRLIICTLPKEIIVDSWRNRKELEYVTSERKLRKVIAAYTRILFEYLAYYPELTADGRRTKNPVLKHDFRCWYADHFVDFALKSHRIRKILQKQENARV